jgi:hypothetical protein
MKACLCLTLAAIVLTLPDSAAAQERRPLREARSENGRFRLRIHPGQPHRGESGSCRAVLFERLEDTRHEREVWNAKLVNEVAPRHVLIRDDGRFVVTLDEFRRGGAAHALVVYDERGRQLREFGLRELLRGDDWKNLEVKQRAVEWLPGATFAFVDEPAQFLIKLKWGREIRIDLEKQEVVRDAGKIEGGAGDEQETGAEKPSGGAEAAIPPEILALLEQPTSAPATAAAEATKETSEQAVERALGELQRLAAESGVEVEGLEHARVAEAAHAESAGAGGRGTDAAGEALGTEVAEEHPLFAGNSAAAGLPVPAPDPANPVDYVAWVLAQTETDGPSAVPLYEAAIDGFVKWEGDRDLYDAALRGDPAALASPEIAAWLEANQDALANFQAATELEYRGMLEVGEEHSLIGIILPSLSPRRDLARAAIIEAKRLEAAGEVDAAMGDYLDNLAAGTQVSQGPTLIENLVGVAIQTQTAESLLDSFAGASGDAIDYARLAEDLENRYRPLRPIAETFQGERAMVLDFIQQTYEWNPDSGCYRVSPDGVQFLANILGNSEDDSFMATTTAFMLAAIGFERMVDRTNDHYDALTEAVMSPYPAAKQALDELEDQVGSPAFRWQNPVLAMLVPSLGRAYHVTTRAATTRQATRLITNLKAYRQQYGTYPDSLDAFGDSDMVLDPFTGGPFVYHRDGDDFTLYSLGGNGVDDGGIHDRRGDTNDVVFWPRPPRDQP